MPVYGKKVSPQEMVGQTFDAITHKIDRGEHQMHFTNSIYNYVFFEPLYCCDAVTVDYFEPVSRILNLKISTIAYEKGKYTFNDTWAMQWTSQKKFYNISMVLLSRQDIK